VLEDVAVVLCDQRLAAVKDLVPVLEAAAKAGMPRLVIAEEVEADALARVSNDTALKHRPQPPNLAERLRKAPSHAIRVHAFATEG
jgi:hypothetical protein